MTIRVMLNLLFSSVIGLLIKDISFILSRVFLWKVGDFDVFHLELAFRYIVDLFVMLRNRSVIRLVFSSSSFVSHENVPSFSIYQCILFLCQSYSTLLCSKQGSCDRNRISDHFLTLHALSKWNNYVDFNLLLQSTDVIHVLVVERILLQLIRSTLPRPVLSESVPLSSLSHPLQSFLRLLLSYCYFIYRNYGSVLVWHGFQPSFLPQRSFPLYSAQTPPTMPPVWFFKIQTSPSFS